MSVACRSERSLLAVQATGSRVKRQSHAPVAARNHTLQIRLGEDEFALLKKQAEELGISMAALVRMLVMKEASKKPDPPAAVMDPMMEAIAKAAAAAVVKTQQELEQG